MACLGPGVGSGYFRTSEPGYTATSGVPLTHCPTRQARRNPETPLEAATHAKCQTKREDRYRSNVKTSW